MTIYRKLSTKKVCIYFPPSVPPSSSPPPPQAHNSYLSPFLPFQTKATTNPLHQHRTRISNPHPPHKQPRPKHPIQEHPPLPPPRKHHPLPPYPLHTTHHITLYPQHHIAPIHRIPAIYPSARDHFLPLPRPPSSRWQYGEVEIKVNVELQLDADTGRCR